MLLVILMSAAAQAEEPHPENFLSEEPEVAYWLHCAGCHGLEGRGIPPEVPSLINEPGRIESMPGGREYLLRVPGVSQAGLDDENLAAVMNYMMYEFNSATLAADFAAFSAAEVAQHRAQVLQDPLRRRSEIVAGVQ
jgi:mono/diheme cytochrome c family protein